MQSKKFSVFSGLHSSPSVLYKAILAPHFIWHCCYHCLLDSALLFLESWSANLCLYNLPELGGTEGHPLPCKETAQKVSGVENKEIHYQTVTVM